MMCLKYNKLWMKQIWFVYVYWFILYIIQLENHEVYFEIQRAWQTIPLNNRLSTKCQLADRRLIYIKKKIIEFSLFLFFSALSFYFLNV